MVRRWKLRKPRLGEETPPPFPAMMRVWDGPEIAEGDEIEVVDLAEVLAILRSQDVTERAFDTLKGSPMRQTSQDVRDAVEAVIRKAGLVVDDAEEATG